ncbi:MAG: 4-hydroxy-tetrahydrodipicolinate synthase [Rickettsiales bacterium]|nr:4-hydroxy-tetrahydrodipicolinate synthase [Rickettsiales bacterium]
MDIKNTYLWTALITPFKKDSNLIDYESLKSLINTQVAARNGLLILGSTGEALSLKDSEKRELVTFICSLELNIPIMVGLPNINLFETLEWLEFCNSLPIDAHFIATPAYTKPGVQGQTKWFSMIFEKSTKPLMLYNIPSRTGVELFPEVISSLENHRNFWALKDSSGSVSKSVEYLNTSKKLTVYSDEDGYMPCLAPLGIKGLVSVLANVWPLECKKYVEQCLTNNFSYTTAWWNAYKEMFVASNPIPIKALLYDLKIISCKNVRIPLSNDDLISSKNLIKAHMAIEKWSSHEKTVSI